MSASNASDYADGLSARWQARADSDAPFGFINEWDDSTVDDIEDVPDYDPGEHDADNLPGEWQKATAYDWLRDVLEIEFLVSSRREYKAARVYVTIGGPNAYFDTASGEIVVHWGFESARRPLPSSIASELDDAAAELWEMSE